MRYFDWQKTARETGISQNKLDALSKVIRQEFPKDDMMYELHLMRVCMSIRDGHVGIDEAIRSETAGLKA
jgi:hypothetical protein